MDYPITPWKSFFNSGACEFSGGKGDVFFDVVYPDWCDWFHKKKWGTIDKQFVPGGSKFGWVLLPLKQLLGRAPINQDTPFTVYFLGGGWYATLLRAHHVGMQHSFQLTRRNDCLAAYWTAIWYNDPAILYHPCEHDPVLVSERIPCMQENIGVTSHSAHWPDDICTCFQQSSMSRPWLNSSDMSK